MPSNPRSGPYPEGYEYDARRSFEDHDPAEEPYASMTRDQVQALMLEARGAEWEHLHEFFLDKCSQAELERIQFCNELAVWLMEKKGTFGFDQCLFVKEVAAEATQWLFEDMPPPGPEHEIN